MADRLRISSPCAGAYFRRDSRCVHRRLVAARLRMTRERQRAPTDEGQSKPEPTPRKTSFRIQRTPVRYQLSQNVRTKLSAWVCLKGTRPGRQRQPLAVREKRPTTK